MINKWINYNLNGTQSFLLWLIDQSYLPIKESLFLISTCRRSWKELNKALSISSKIIPETNGIYCLRIDEPYISQFGGA